MIIFLREYIGKLNKIRSLFRNFKMKLFYFIEEQNLGYVLGFQGTYLESLLITHFINIT